MLRSYSPTSIAVKKQELLLKELLASYHRSVNKDQYALVGFAAEAYHLLQDIVAPVLSTTGVEQGHSPNVPQYNSDFKDLLMDLNALYQETNGLQILLTGNFNDLASTKGDIEGHLKEVFGLLADYKLYSTRVNQGIVYVTDTFNNIAKTDVGSDFI